MSVPRWVPPAAWAAVILVLTSVPVPSTPVNAVVGIDKLAHVAMYLVLGALVARAAIERERRWRSAVLGMIGVLLFAAVDEWHQSFVPGRSTDALDWAADALGTLLGSALGARALLRSERYT